MRTGLKLTHGRRILAVLSIASLIVLAGCAGKGNKPTAALVGATPAEFDENTGGIEGVILNDEDLPVPGASVGIVSLGISTTTDSVGAYSLSKIEPGEQVVHVAVAGYASASRAVTVVAGEALRGVDFSLEPIALPGSLPPIQDQKRGMFGCGSSARTPAGSPGVNACAVFSIPGEVGGPDTSGYNQNTLNWELDRPTADLSAIVFEMEWASTQALGRGLSLSLEILGCSNASGGEGLFADLEGESPLRIVLTKEKIHEVLDLEDPSCNVLGVEEPKECGESSCTLISRVFAGTATAGPDAAADIGMTVQQPFTHYITAFYGEQPAGLESYTHLAP